MRYLGLAILILLSIGVSIALVYIGLYLVERHKDNKNIYDPELDNDEYSYGHNVKHSNEEIIEL